MFKQYRVRRGEPVKASDFNDLLDEVHRLRKLMVSPPLFLTRTANGIQIGFDSPIRPVRGLLTEDITESTNQGQTETESEMSVFTGKGANWSDSGRTITLVNRDDTLSADIGALVVAFYIDGEWCPLWVGC